MTAIDNMEVEEGYKHLNLSYNYNRIPEQLEDIQLQTTLKGRQIKS